MRFSGFAAIAGIAATTSQPAYAGEPVVLEPSSHWELDYEADSCALRRMFGEGEQLTQLEMRRFQPSIGLQVTIASRARMTRRSVRVRFGDEGHWYEDSNPLFAYFDDSFEGLIFTTGLFELPLEKDADSETRDRFVIENDVPALEAEAAAKVSHLTIEGAFRDDVILDTGSLKAPIAALNECVDELLNHWSIDAEAHKTRTRSAVPLDFAKASRMISYPPRMVRESMPGLVNIRLDIDEIGRVTECYIQMPLSDPIFEERSCTDIRRAFKFKPALDKDGQPMKSYYVTAVHFRIGG